MRPGDLVQLKSPSVYNFRVSLWDSPQNTCDYATGIFGNAQVGIVLETRRIRKAGEAKPVSWDSSLVLVGGVVGWTDTVELELVE